VYVPLASEPIGRWPTGRNRLVLYCIVVYACLGQVLVIRGVLATGSELVTTFDQVVGLSSFNI
jgi:hypothetical protein